MRLVGTALLILIISGACAQAEEPEIASLFEASDPSVVLIRTVEESLVPLAQGASTRVQTQGQGSGVLIDEEGRILTAAHVVQVAERIEVLFIDGSTSSAQVISSAPQADVALTQVDEVPEAAKVAPLGNSDDVRVGEKVYLIGAPYGIEHTLTVGYISGRRAPEVLYTGEVQAERLQTDAAMNPGNSGGPLFNMQGEVIGIASHIISSSGGSEGLGFVVTSNMARKLLLEKQGIWTGMHLVPLGPELAKLLNVPKPGIGLLVERVAKGSPAEFLGLRGGDVQATIEGRELLLGGDIILEIFGIPVGQGDAFARVRARQQELKEGDRIEVLVLREGRRETLQTYFFPSLQE